jgi:hypothetical protein
VSFSDRDRSELRLELLRLRGETFICWKHWLDSDTGSGDVVRTYERALVFLLLRLRRRTRFFLHLALILSAGCGMRSAAVQLRSLELMASAGTLKEQSLRSIECRERRHGWLDITYIAVEMSVVSVEQR